MDHLAEAKDRAGYAVHDQSELAQFNTQLGILHVLIAIAERLPQPAETWSGCGKRLRKEEQDGL